MRFFLFGPRFFGVRPGVSFDPSKPLSSRPRDAVDEKAFVYVIKGEHGRIKVGMTIDLDQRIAQFANRIGVPDRIRLCAGVWLAR